MLIYMITSLLLTCFCLHNQIQGGTVQLGYCDSDVTVCLLFWNMPIIRDRDVKCPYKRYRYYLQALQAKSNCVPVVTEMYHNRSFCVENETAQVRILA